MKSGLDLGLFFTSLENALECCEALLATGHNWASLDTEEAGELGDEAIRAAAPALRREMERGRALLSRCVAHLDRVTAQLKAADADVLQAEEARRRGLN